MAIEMPDLEGVEENQFGGMCPVGWHTVEVSDVQAKPASNGSGNTVLHFFFETKDGYSLRDWLTISPKTLPNLKAKLRILNYTIPAGPFSLDEKVLVGRKCQVLVKHEPYIDAESKEQRRSAKIETWAAAGTQQDTDIGNPSAGPDDDIPF